MILSKNTVCKLAIVLVNYSGHSETTYRVSQKSVYGKPYFL